ncbi:hypothetical protein MJ1HA_1468 [Metallosphaera sedula]|nr:hypothetical protein MJ1HA_1468 [Metallosphaera sedula]
MVKGGIVTATTIVMNSFMTLWNLTYIQISRFKEALLILNST